MFKGIFLLKPDGLISVKVRCDENGSEPEPRVYPSKSNGNFNHRIEWEKLPRSVKAGSAYNRYPRGRVEIGKGKAVLWLNPCLADAETFDLIKKEFDLGGEPIGICVKPDHSDHYKCRKDGQ